LSASYYNDENVKQSVSADIIAPNWKSNIRFLAIGSGTDSTEPKESSEGLGDVYQLVITGLPKYMPGQEGKALTYSLTEVPLSGYAQVEYQNSDGDAKDSGTAETGDRLKNTHDTGSLEITKSVISDLTSDNTREFAFEITASPAISGEYVLRYTGGTSTRIKAEKITFVNGTAQGLILTKDETVTISGLPTDVTYTVTEKLTDEQAASFKTPVYEGQSQKLENKDQDKGDKIYTTVTNTRKTGNVILRKVVNSPVPAEESASYDMTVTLTPKEIGAQIVAPSEGFTVKNYAPKEEGSGFDETTSKMALAKGENTISVPAGGYVVINGLPVDVDYNITEPGNGQFEKAYVSLDAADDEGTAVDGSEVSGSIGADATTGAEVTNTRKKGELNISKTVVSSVQDDKTHEFRFRVTIDKTGANGAVIADSSRTVSYGDGITFTNNVA